MRPSIALLVTLVGLVLADSLVSQRRGRGRRGRAQAVQQPEPEADKKVKNWLAITGGDVHLGTGQVITRATVLVGDDKIVEVGHNLEIPEGATIIDATGKIVSPGFVIVTASGMGGPSGTGPAKDSVNPFNSEMKRGLAVGITSFMAGSPQGSNRPGGNTSVIKLAYGELDGMVLQEGSTFGMSVPLNPSQIRGFRELVAEIREYREDLKEAGSGEDAPTPPQGSENIIKIMDGESRLWISGRPFNTTEIRQALEISQLLGVGVVLQEPVTAWLIPDEIAATGSMVVLNPRTATAPNPSAPDSTGSNIAAARILEAAGVPVAVRGGGRLGTGGMMGNDLNTPHFDAAFAVRGGLDNRKALRTITLDAARAIGADHRIGSIEPGKDADLLILDGDPLHYKTFPEIVIVNGKIVYEKDKEPFYSHIKR
jgi:hypothetical protein